MKKASAFLATLLALVLGSQEVGISDQGVYRAENTPLAAGQILSAISDSSGGRTESFLAIQPSAVTVGGTRGDWRNCTSLSDPVCANAGPTDDVHSQAIAPYCKDATQVVCIESIEVAIPGGDFKAATFVSHAGKGQTFEANPSVNFPEATTPQIFKTTEVVGSGNTNQITATLVTHWHLQQQSGKFLANRFDLSIMPTTFVSQAGTQGCLYLEASGCGLGQDWLPGVKVRAKIRIPKDLGGWFKGRVMDPKVSISSGPGDNNTVTVEAQVVEVPRLAIARNLSDLTPTELMWIQNNGRWGVTNGWASGPEASQANVSQFIDASRAVASDSASGTNTLWNIGSTYTGTGSPCLRSNSEVLGIVTTNAMGYDGSSPSFANGILTYHVSGMHYLADKTTLAEGAYDLVMRSSTARCLYNFSSAPIQATVSVIDDKGETKAAVTTVNENDGWLKMRAYGFTFSNPTLNVTMTQPKEAEKIVKLLTCSKGKTVLKVTTKKCPTGYKLK